jgi:CBS domain-containing protein
MSAPSVTCTPDTNLAAAAESMITGDCGFLPVVSGDVLVGVVTDRDLFIALGTRDRKPSETTVAEVMQAPVWTCAPDDDLHAALDMMKEHRVRRLPVSGFGGSVMGVLSVEDLLRAAGTRQGLGTSELTDALKAICAHRHAAPRLAVA